MPDHFLNRSLDKKLFILGFFSSSISRLLSRLYLFFFYFVGFFAVYALLYFFSSGLWRELNNSNISFLFFLCTLSAIFYNSQIASGSFSDLIFYSIDFLLLVIELIDFESCSISFYRLFELELEYNLLNSLLNFLFSFLLDLNIYSVPIQEIWLFNSSMFTWFLSLINLCFIRYYYRLNLFTMSIYLNSSNS